MLKAAGEEGVELVRLLAETVISSGDIPKDWEESFILNLYKGKEEALDRGNYRSLKLTDQVMKLLDRMLDSFIRNMVDIDKMQFGFVPGRGTTDAIFIARHCNCKRSTLQPRSLSTSRLSILRKHSTVCLGKCSGGH